MSHHTDCPKLKKKINTVLSTALVYHQIGRCYEISHLNYGTEGQSQIYYILTFLSVIWGTEQYLLPRMIVQNIILGTNSFREETDLYQKPLVNLEHTHQNKRKEVKKGNY